MALSLKSFITGTSCSDAGGEIALIIAILECAIIDALKFRNPRQLNKMPLVLPRAESISRKARIWLNAKNKVFAKYVNMVGIDEEYAEKIIWKKIRKFDETGIRPPRTWLGKN